MELRWKNGSEDLWVVGGGAPFHSMLLDIRYLRKKARERWRECPVRGFALSREDLCESGTGEEWPCAESRPISPATLPPPSRGRCRPSEVRGCGEAQLQGVGVGAIWKDTKHGPSQVVHILINIRR